MLTSRSGSRKIVLVSLIGVLFALAYTTYFVFHRPEPPLTATHTSASLKQEESKQEPGIGSPVRIRIPRIGVDAVLEYVGLTSEGEMEVPTGPDNAAWLNRHPVPGETGTSVIAGHYGYKDDKPAIFDNLHKLRKGDKLYVEDNKGAVTGFVVHALMTFRPEQDAAEVFSSSDGKSHLNLITCSGIWNKARKSYNTRLVVFADKE